MKTIHVVMTQDKKIWVFSSPSKVSHFLNGEMPKCRVERNVDFLSRFLKENPDIKKDLPKAIGYWIGCNFFHKEEDNLRYGLIKRLLYDFGGKEENLLKGIRSEAKKISREIKRKLRYTEDPKPRYKNKKRRVA